MHILTIGLNSWDPTLAVVVSKPQATPISSTLMFRKQEIVGETKKSCMGIED